MLMLVRNINSLAEWHTWQKKTGTQKTGTTNEPQSLRRIYKRHRQMFLTQKSRNSQHSLGFFIKC